MPISSNLTFQPPDLSNPPDLARAGTAIIYLRDRGEGKGKGSRDSTSRKELSRGKMETWRHGAEGKVPRTFSGTDERLARFR
jgi:hypothetical protein